MGAEKLPEIKEALGRWRARRAKAFDEEEVRHIAEQVRADAGLTPFGKCAPGMMCHYASGELVNALRAVGYEAR